MCRHGPVEHIRPAGVDRLQEQRTFLQRLAAARLLTVLILQLNVVRVGLLDGIHQLPDQAIVPRCQQVVGLFGNARMEQQRAIQRRRHRREGVRYWQLAEHVRQAGQTSQGGDWNTWNIAIPHGCPAPVAAAAVQR